MFTKMKKAAVAVLTLGSASFAMADGAAMASTVQTAITDNSAALWTVGGSVIVLSVIGLIIRKINRQAS